MRILGLFFGLAVIVIVPFLIWGQGFERAFTLDGAVAWLADYGDWAWAAGIVLLISDLVLPIPATAVMAALGVIYGPLIGGAIATAGTFLAGSFGYGLCRLFGRNAAARLLGPTELARGERLFSRIGGWLVVLSRWLPVFPEVIACMAGLTRMPARAFFTALACGCVPLAFVFATVGHLGARRPFLTLAASALVPPLLWLVLRRRVRPREVLPVDEPASGPSRRRRRSSETRYRDDGM